MSLMEKFKDLTNKLTKKKDVNNPGEQNINNNTNNTNSNNNVETNEANKNSKLKVKTTSVSIKKDTPVFVISTDINDKFINVLSMIGNDLTTITITRLPYKTRPLDEEFFEKLKSILDNFLKDKPSKDVMAVYVVFPNECVSTDLFNIPTIGKKQMSSSININLDQMYKNKKDLLIKHQVIVANKQYSSYYILSVNKQIIASFYSTLANCGMYAKSSSYLGNSLISAVLHIQPKRKNDSFIFVDIKKEHTYFAITNKGRTIGHYYLQFGYKILETNKLAYENMLVNHDLAEITVLNAKEKAKAKQLTSLAEEPEEGAEGEVAPQVQEGKVLGKKVPKRLPKFMQRPLPESEEEMACENFRLFTKWILLVANNYARKGIEFEFDYALINMPEKFNFIIEKYKSDENKPLEFIAFNDNIGLSEEVKENLELFGALYLNQHNKNQTF